MSEETPAPKSEEFSEVEEVEAPAKEPVEDQKVGDAVKDIVDKTDPPVEKKKYKVKIDKEELEVDEEELLKGYQLRKASDKRFQEASEKAKIVENVLQLLKKDPRQALSHPEIGLNPRQLAEQWLAEYLQEEMMDPKEREYQKLRREKEEADAKLKEIDEKERKGREEQLTNEYAERYRKDIEETIKASGLPYNQGIINRVRDYMLVKLDAGEGEVSAKDVISFVKKDFEADVKALFETSTPEMLAQILGEPNLKKVRSWDVGRVKSPTQATPKEQGPADKTRKTEGSRKTMTTEEYFEKLREKFKDTRED